MTRLPDRPNLAQLKKQAKDLLTLYRRRDPAALSRFRDSLPLAAGRDDAAIAALGLRLHDAQSCLAREYGFAGWADLAHFVAAREISIAQPSELLQTWLRLTYPGDIAGGMDRARPAVAARLLEQHPDLLGDDPWLACAVGDEARLRRAVSEDPQWIDRPGGPLHLPPLVAVTHSSFLRLPAFRDRLRACARFQLNAGADPNQKVGNRWPPASLEAPSQAHPLSVLYGAAGQNHDPALTDMLLAAGADPNDGESLYHAVESLDCTRRLLEAGARVAGTNALFRVLDLDRLDVLKLLLAYGGDPNEPAPGTPTVHGGAALLWAIRRRRSPAHIAALLEVGADPGATTPDGVSAHVWALRYGLTEVAEMLSGATGPVTLPFEERFLAACAKGDAAEARRLQAERPDLPNALSEAQLRLLPELAAAGNGAAVEVMVTLGWPIAVAGGDWQASALNHAVFRGDAAMTRFLLQHGASWREMHGFGDDASGTLSWASVNEPEPGGDWLGCAEALVAHGMPGAEPGPVDSGTVVVDGRRKRFSDEVTDFLLGASHPPTPQSAI
jgi:ankyrin repeat protein